MGSIQGQILRVNLSEQEYQVEELDEELYKEYIGSRGLGSKLFHEEVPGGIDPFAEENKIFIMAGALNGTKVPAAPKHTWVSQSPLNGFYAEGSTSGGSFAPYLKQNGFDGIVIEGKADRPMYFVVEDGEVSFHKAEKYWGLKVTEAERPIKERFPDMQTAIIGPAGENKVRYAAVRVERRSVGRTGLGAVMGSKNLKALGVMPGEEEVEVADEEKMDELISDFYEQIRVTQFTSETRRKYGTTHMFDFINDNGVMPTKNFQLSMFEKDTSDFNHETIREKFTIEDEACHRCPIVCGKKMLAREGKYAGSSNAGPEWETMWSFGPQCDNNSMEVVIKANELCNELGLDTISAGNVVGFAMECYERGLITEEDLGYELDWGDDEAILQLVRDIASQRNFGAELAEGTIRVAEDLGVEDIAMQVKGVEIPAYDPRSVWGMGLAYATSSRGACHLRSFTPSAELEGLGGGRTSIEGKAEFVVNDQNIRGTFEAAGQCFTSTAAITPKFYAKLLSAATGLDLSENDLYEIGERIYNVERLLAEREGYKRDSDTLPGRLFNEEVKNGPAEGEILPEDKFLEMLEEYYELRGWNPEDGTPTEEKLSELGLK